MRFAEAGHRAGDVFQLEEEVFRTRAERAAAAQAAGRRKQQTQAAGRFEFGKGDAAVHIAPKALEPARRRELVDDLQAKYGASQSQACAVMMISRSVYQYRSRRADQKPLVMRIKEIAAARRALRLSAHSCGVAARGLDD